MGLHERQRDHRPVGGEAQHRIVTSSTWDEFAYFAGGHGDIVSTATYELPLLEDKTGIKTVTFGKYNLLRITPITRADSGYKTLADIPKGSKIAVPSSAVSSTLVWGMFATQAARPGLPGRRR